MDEMESGYDTPRSAQEAANMENLIPRSMVPQDDFTRSNITLPSGDVMAADETDRMLEQSDYFQQSPQGLAFLKNKLGDMWGGAKDKLGEMWGGAKDIGAQTFEGIKNIGSSAGQMAIGPLSWLAGKMDKFDQLPMADQMFISQQMGGAGQMGAGVYRDPQSGAIRDLGGKNVRSMFGNYSDAVHTEFNRYDRAIKRSEQKYGVTFNPDTGKFEGENAENANKMNRRNLEMFGYYRDKKQSQQKLSADYGRAQQKKEQEAAAAKQQAVQSLSGLTTQGGGRGIASAGVASGRVDPSGMGGGSRQATSAGAQKTDRKDRGWGWREGGLASLWQR